MESCTYRRRRRRAGPPPHPRGPLARPRGSVWVGVSLWGYVCWGGLARHYIVTWQTRGCSAFTLTKRTVMGNTSTSLNCGGSCSLNHYYTTPTRAHLVAGQTAVLVFKAKDCWMKSSIAGYCQVGKYMQRFIRGRVGKVGCAIAQLPVRSRREANIPMHRRHGVFSFVRSHLKGDTWTETNSETHQLVCEKSRNLLDYVWEVTNVCTCVCVLEARQDLWSNPLPEFLWTWVKHSPSPMMCHPSTTRQQMAWPLWKNSSFSVQQLRAIFHLLSLVPICFSDDQRMYWRHGWDNMEYLSNRIQ